MSDKFFLDTNIFIYCFDDRQPQKQKRALALVASALESGDGLISTQVIQEFLNVALRKFSAPLKIEDCLVYMQKVLHPLCKITPDLEYYSTALNILQETGYSFYDALILSGAARGGCVVLYSEDLQNGQQVAGVTIVNPFNT
jgi:predicted nucleic acid-binding protein